MRLLSSFLLSEKKCLALLFFTGFVVRLVPEILAFPHPIGFDTVYYAVVMRDGALWSHWSTFFTSTWLFPALSVLSFRVVGGDPFMLLKVLAPLLFGLNVAGVFWFARKMLGWSVHAGLLAGLFFAFQLASLRISWDLLRNTLGLGLLLFALSLIKRLDSRRNLVCFVFLSLLSVFAHEYAGVTLFAVVFGLVFWSLLKGAASVQRRLLLLAAFPAVSFFLVGFCLRVFPVRYSVETNVLGAGDAVEGSVGGLFFLTNYLVVKNSVDFYASYFDLVLSVGALFCVLYLPYIFLVWKGFFRERVLNVWTALLLVGAFSCLFLPFGALQYWHRWMFMLVYPFTFYAVNGLKGFLGGCNGGGFGFSLKFWSGKVKGMLLLTVLLGVVYLVTPVLMSTVNVGLFAVNPVNRYISFAPGVPYQDVEGVVSALGWLNGNMFSGDCVLMQHAFLFWGRLCLDKSHVMVHFEGDFDLAVAAAQRNGFSRVFLVWWNEPIGWYGLNVPEGFTRLADFGRISIYSVAYV